MKTLKHSLTRAGRFCALALGLFSITAAAQTSITRAQYQSHGRQPTPIPMEQLGAVASNQYQGDGLSVTAIPGGARLRCAFQKLEGDVSADGLWLRSALAGSSPERFRVRAAKVGRDLLTAVWDLGPTFDSLSWMYPALSPAGTVKVSDHVARFIRDRLTEEYSVSVDGVRQDFMIEQRPAGDGELCVELEVAGAMAVPLANGARLTMNGSGRNIVYSRLRVTDAMGRELPARMEVTAASRLVVAVDDTAAVYPVRIDPTFSDANWISLGGIAGANDGVRATVVDGSGNLYIGGDFSIVGDVFANRIAKWNGTNWSALGSGMDGTVYALAVSGSDVYAGGYFTTAGGIAANSIAKWDGSSWSALGSGVQGLVAALAVSGSDLYAGGDFTTAGGNVAFYIAKRDGSSWSALGSGMGAGPFGTTPSVSALAVSGSDLYAGGQFTMAGGRPANYIAKWNGNSWSALGSGMPNGGLFSTPPSVSALAVSGSDLYAGGAFTNAGGTSANGIAKWDGSGWSALGSGMDGTVLALAVSGGDLYAAGGFTTAGGNLAANIAKWDGSSWSTLGLGIAGSTPWVNALAVSGSNVYAGGWFTTAGGSATTAIAKWNGSNWSGLGSAINGTVRALAVSGSDVYAAGYFTAAGGITANRIVKWNGSDWSQLGLGMNNNVYALAVSGSDLYVGGFFTRATNSGGVAATANRIARWDGSNWSALGSGMNASVSAVAVSGSDVYAGGSFTTAGGNTVNGIAKWDGTNWSALGSGVGGDLPWVWALAVSGSDLYAGGYFTTVTNNGGMAVTVDGIAKWDGTNWSALGPGAGGSVRALAVLGGDVYAGGFFPYIAKWNGSTWSTLGLGMDSGSTYALAVSGSDLYAGGAFTSATNSGGAGLTVNRIARWNGSSWSSLGSGVDDWVWALAVSGSDLYVGGDFATAGGKVSAYIARASLPATLPTLSILRSGPDVRVYWPSANTTGFTLEQAGTLAASVSWVTNAASVADDGTNKSVTLPAANNAQFFRLRRP